MIFQLTTSQGGRRGWSLELLMVLYFNSRPHKEVDIDLTTTYNFLDISTHDLTRRSTSYHALFLFRCSIFQLTTSQGGRPTVAKQKAYNEIISTHDLTRRSTGVALPASARIIAFQLTTSQGGRPRVYHHHEKPLLFQLTTSQGGRLWQRGIVYLANYFNSRPHKEVDGESFWWFIECINISTHDLTRRSTECVWLNFWRRRYFNSRPHKEVDNRPSVPVFTSKIFQLTTSQGGRLLLRQRKQTMHTYFNSRPHKEVDIQARFLLSIYFISTHDLTRRSTLHMKILAIRFPFQLTTSQGGRPMLSFRYQPPLAFQLTTSQGGRPVKIIAFFNYRDFNSRPHKEVDP